MRVLVRGVEAYVHAAQRDLDRADPTALMLHGAGQDHTLWRLHARALASAGWNALAPDLPGHGLSDGGPLETIPDMAQWSGELLERLGISVAILVGHSMGSLVAMQLVLDQPARVAGLVLTGSAGAMPVHPRLLEAADAGDDEALELVVGWVHTGLGRMGTAVQPGTWEPGLTRRVMGRSLPLLASDLEACDRHRFEDLGGIRCPVVVVAGDRDRMTPARGARELVDALPKANLVLVPGVGHDVVSRSHRIVAATIGQMRDLAFG